jgi:hypothetical protein
MPIPYIPLGATPALSESDLIAINEAVIAGVGTAFEDTITQVAEIHGQLQEVAPDGGAVVVLAASTPGRRSVRVLLEKLSSGHGGVVEGVPVTLSLKTPNGANTAIIGDGYAWPVEEVLAQMTNEEGYTDFVDLPLTTDMKPVGCYYVVEANNNMLAQFSLPDGDSTFMARLPAVKI